LQKQTGDAVTYRYEFDRPRPLPPGSTGNLTPRAFHSAEIEFVFSMLPKGDKPWPAEDRSLSSLMSAYWANFAKTGDPNGAGLPQWPAYDAKDDFAVMYFNAQSKAQPDKDRARFLLLDSASSTASQAVRTPSSAATARPNSAARAAN
jgi:para-nitrobenzyl esterase